MSKELNIVSRVIVSKEFNNVVSKDLIRSSIIVR